ncbi:methyl-accepting chemotaxis protein [Paraburkholderia sp. J8-2]|uniref:methyl-accepting chemotaxis protein n=1 Tax=Paraburkholderia sp. J8-2 TaxID=2805440 RepID=UPI002AB6ABC7|nr:methyl-accepting chemotaxis protein [Paraburkholderia sp. J8-2]
MRGIALKVRFKLLMGFGTCAVLMLLIAAASGFGLATVGADAPPGSRFLMTTQLAITLSAGVAAVGFGWWIDRTVAGALDRMVAHFGEVADTLDLSKRLSNSRGEPLRMDEFSHVAAAFDRLMQRVEEAVFAVIGSTDLVAIATREIVLGNLDLSSRTEQQAASLGQTATSMGDLTSTVRHNAESARAALDLASMAQEVVARGNAVVSDVVVTMSGISVSSAKITEIIGMIESIAFQTNILALNAAVEAARAGEEGRGFAVVAGEVRSLAQRAAGAAREIKGLIDASVGQIDGGSELVRRAGVTMSEVSRSVSRLTEIMGEIAAESDRQSSRIAQISQAVAQMDIVTQQNASLVEQSAATAQSLDEQAKRLHAAVSVFGLTSR